MFSCVGLNNRQPSSPADLGNVAIALYTLVVYVAEWGN